jgi:hypothetical protein
VIPSWQTSEVGVEPPRGLLDQTGGRPAFLDQPVDLGGPDLDKRELGGHEETIQDDREKISQYPEGGQY